MGQWLLLLTVGCWISACPALVYRRRRSRSSSRHGSSQRLLLRPAIALRVIGALPQAMVAPQRRRKGLLREAVINPCFLMRCNLDRLLQCTRQERR
jgi:hypothetical protein